MLHLNLKNWFSWLWSSTDLNDDEMTRYAEQFMVKQVGQGVGILGLVTLLLLIASSVLYGMLQYSDIYQYTCAMLGLLCLHVIFSSRKVSDSTALFLLCMTLIIVSGVSFVLLAHHEGNFSNVLLPTVVVLFMVIPIVPWGLREGLITVSLVYLVFTLSTLSIAGKFSTNNLLVLQFMMLVSAVVSLVILSRNVSLRKDDIKARYELEKAHRQMERLSYEDGLTGAWNRRYLEVQFNRLTRRILERTNDKVYFGILDIDDFKQINDEHGHLTGDDTLKRIVEIFQQTLNESSYVFRIGGDEFVILFEAQDYTVALQQAIDKLRQKSATAPGLKVSIGVVAVEGNLGDISLESLYKEADKSLYKAKSRKRSTKESLNCVMTSLQTNAAL